MQIEAFGLSLSIKSLPSLYPPSSRGGLWWPIIKESFAGAWQRNVEITVEDVVTNPVVWSCVTLIASDISKLWLNLKERDENGIWTEIENTSHSPVLRTPNHYSTRIKFYEYWMLSKLLRGNTYALKRRDGANRVDALYVLDSTRVQVLIAQDGSVFYQIDADDLTGIGETVTVPAREIIHDVMVPLYHPLVGVSPIYAAGMAALQGLKIQRQSSKLFENGSQPGGVLTAPQFISNETAERLQQHWMANYAGEQNIGKIVVLGDGLKYEPMTMTAVDAQLIDQLKWSDERICACFHVPGYMVGIGPAPPYTDIQSINLQYYNQALQAPIENLEELLDKGLELPTSPRRLGVEFDKSALLSMDTATQIKNAVAAVGGGILKPNEARAEFDRKPVEGGDAVYLQQQNYSLAALDRRDSAEPAPATTATPQRQITERVDDDVEMKGWEPATMSLLVHQKMLKLQAAA